MKCQYCNKQIPREEVGRNTKYCSARCSHAASLARYLTGRNTHKKDDVATATTGAIHELLICVDLMWRGYHVFRAQSPCCPCDVIAMIDGDTYKVEVTTGKKTMDGRCSYPRKNERYDFDILAVVFRDGDIAYFLNTPGIAPPNIPCNKERVGSLHHTSEVAAIQLTKKQL